MRDRPSGGVARPELDIVVVVPPSGLLRVLMTRLHVEGVVRGPFLRAEGNITLYGSYGNVCCVS